MTIADIVALAILALSALFAFFRGFVREALSIGAWVAAAAATWFGLPLLRPYARQYISIDLIADAAAATAIFITVLIIGAIISHVLTRHVRTSAFGALDRSLGLLYGLLRGAVLVCFLFLLIDWALPAEERPEEIANARTLPLVAAGAELLKSLLPEGAAAEGREAAEAAKKQVEQAIDVGTATGALGSSETPENAGEAGGESAGPAGDSGYKDAERKDLDRLIQGTQ